jgi:hypothetical protein
MNTIVGLDFQMLTLDVCLQRLRLPERLVAWGKVGAVELGLVDVSVPLEPSIGGETLAASVPIAYERSLSCRVTMSVL